MRLHSDVLTGRQVMEACPSEVSLSAAHKGSRSHARAFEVHLSASYAPGRRRANGGTYGAGDDYAATWDEWGMFLARLYALDPAMVCGSVKSPVYASRSDFAWSTGDRYGDGSTAPAMMSHPHRWESIGYGEQACRHAECPAVRRWHVGVNA